MRLQIVSVDVRRAWCAPRPFGEGFVDISMYVVLGRPSKNAACMLPDNVRRIFRKLRLAVFERLCRLPIGLGSLWARTRQRFPVLRCRMSGIANENVVIAAGNALLSLRQQRPYFRPFLAAGSSQSDNSGREPASLATHRAGRAYYIYVASQNAKRVILAGNPKGSFDRSISSASDSAGQDRNSNREVGAIAPLRLAA
jgi:hypothetical protein